MEIAGLAIGVASLYSACIDAAHRIESYKNFQVETRQLAAQFQADKAILQRWADKVGILRDGFSDTYDRRLNNPEIARAVKDILLSIRILLEGAQGKTHHDKPTRSFSTRQLVIVPDPTQSASISSRKRDKISWAFGGKERSGALVDTFGALVAKLGSLIPIDTGLEQPSLMRQPPQASSEDTKKYSLLVEKTLRRFKGERKLDDDLLKTLIRIDEDKREFLAWLGPTQDSERYKSCRACRTEGTCSWIFELESFVEWRSARFTNGFPKFLWIHGPAGYGKSVICAAVVDLIQQDLRLVHHFVPSSPNYQEDIMAVLRSWIAQMTLADDQLLDIALEEVRSAPLEAGKSNLWKLFTTFVRENSEWTFVLDGLDEFQNLHNRQKQNSGEARVEFLTELQTAVLGTHSRVLVVSRDEPDIRSCLSAAEANISGVSLYEHRILTADVECDVLALSRSVVAKKLANKSDSIKAEIAEIMAAKCEGMFLWIDLHRHDLRAGKNRRQLQQTIEEMPAGLDSVYERNWNDITRLTGYDKSRALDILRWVTFAARPLTVAELTEALLVSDDGKASGLRIDDLPDCIDDEYIDSEIRGLCGSFLDVSSTGPDQLPGLRIIHLRHFSVKQFLLTKNAQTGLSDIDFEDPSSSQTANNHLAISCLRYLMDDNVQEDLRLQGGKRSFIDYATRFWHSHASRPGARYRALNQIATDFFTSSMLDWTLWRSRFHHLWKPEHPEGGSDEQEHPSPMYYAAMFDLEEVIEDLHSKDPGSIDVIGSYHGTPIKAAYAAGHSQLVMRLVALGADLDISAGCHGSLLGCACHRGDLQFCKFLLAKDVSLLAVDCMNRSPLYTACRCGHTDVLKLLIEHGANPSVMNTNGWTPLNVASALGHAAMVEQLLGHNVDLSIGDNKCGRTPLHSACFIGNLEVVNLLLKHGASLSVQDADGCTPFHMASALVHAAVVEQLLDYNADLSVVSKDGSAPLHIACVNGSLEVVKLLLERNADVSIMTIKGFTPINIASDKGHVEIVKLLLEHNANISIPDELGWTPLNSASDSGHFEIVKLLLEHNANINIPSTSVWTPVNSASNRGHIEIVKLLLEHNADISIPDTNGWTPVHSASESGHVETVKLLLEHNADISIPNKSGWTPIHSASDSGHIETVKLLLEHGADISIPNTNGWTPINSASNKGHVEIVELLLKHNADISIPDTDGWTPINSASDSGHVKIVKLLLEHNADISIPTTNGRMPIYSASQGGFEDVVRLLIEHNAEVSVGIEDGWTPLHAAANEGHIEVIKVLLEHKADISSVTIRGLTPLHAASSNGHIDIVKLLIEHNASISVATDDGWTPLHAASFSGHIEIVKLLIKHNAEISATDIGWTLLHSASSNGHIDIVKLLIKYKYNTEISAATDKGWTPLHAASSDGHIETVKFLIEHNAKISVATDIGWTPLHAASSSGHIETVKLLIEHNAEISATDEDGWTPLYAASKNGHIKIVEALLEHKADVQVADIKGHTPLHRAADQGHLEMVNYLLAKGSDPRSVTNLSETSLHLASRRDSLEMVDVLVAQGFDAEQMDAYGRTCLDWLAMCPRFVTSRNWLCQYTPTPTVTSKDVLRKTILELVNQAIARKTSLNFYTLGRCLCLIGDKVNSYFALQPQNVPSIICSRCESGEQIVGNCYMCTSCADTDLCEDCFKVFRKDEEPWRCHNHDFVQVPRNESQKTSHESPERDLLEWLSGIREQYALTQGHSISD